MEETAKKLKEKAEELKKELGNVMFGISLHESYFGDDYIKHLDKPLPFSEIIDILGEPVDKEECKMLATRVNEILSRRVDIMETACKIVENHPIITEITAQPGNGVNLFEEPADPF